MGWLKKKTDPISDRARALSEEIAALEEQIKRLDAQAHAAPPPPRLRSTALPHGAAGPAHVAVTTPVQSEPIFEEVDQNRLQAKEETVTTPEHYNDLASANTISRPFCAASKIIFAARPR
jgi:hypothetical protein